ncbi:MAG: radical SAM protein [Candidatus Omnitrophica bacterium]|nr:radical SAM protein [Candidatus Omnitrophota bacterium]MCM8826695.1 radical SAM protein [Candidatus Omnitrophota bacterium]
MRECSLISFNEIINRIYLRTKDRGLPLQGSIELTFRCNLNCQHCYVGSLRRVPSHDELSTTEIYRIIDEIVEAGCLYLLITGGECLVREDFLDIYSYIKKKGIFPIVFTNGTLLNKDIVDYFVDYPPFVIEITLYGIREETYESVTQVKGSFKRCMEGIKLLKGRGIYFDLKTVLCKLNYYEFLEIKEFANKMGITNFRFDPILNGAIDGDNSLIFQLRLFPEEAIRIERLDSKKWEIIEEEYKKYGRVSLDFDFLYNCGAGKNTFHIDPYGRISMCMLSREPSFSLRENSFKEVFYESFPQLRNIKSKVRKEKCSGCELSLLCLLCPGWAYLENGNPDSVAEYLCRLTKIRKEIINREVESEKRLS